MLSYKVTVRNPSGLHLRPAGLLCGEAIKYKSSITFQYAGGTANAKSVLSVLGCLLYTSRISGSDTSDPFRTKDADESESSVYSSDQSQKMCYRSR